MLMSYPLLLFTDKLWQTLSRESHKLGEVAAVRGDVAKGEIRPRHLHHSFANESHEHKGGVGGSSKEERQPAKQERGATQGNRRSQRRLQEEKMRVATIERTNPTTRRRDKEGGASEATNPRVPVPKHEAARGEGHGKRRARGIAQVDRCVENQLRYRRVGKGENADQPLGDHRGLRQRAG